MPERRWRVAGRGRGLFAIEVDAALQAAGAVPGGGVPGAARRRGRTRGRCRRRLNSSGNLVAVMDELYAVGWRSVGRSQHVGVVGIPVVGSGGSRSARLCGVRRWRPVARLRHAGCPSPATGGSRRSRGRQLAEGLETRRQD